MEELGHWINGKRVAGTSGRFADVYNPATGEVLAEVTQASQADEGHASKSSAPTQKDRNTIEQLVR